jgi:serine/threonine protein kinase
MVPAGQTSSLRRRIGKYVITGRIGRGGMGMVYRAYDEALERDIALKTLTAEGTLDDESRKRFQIEARAAAKLQHPNIVTVFELGEDRGIPFIAMELLPGADLEALVRSGEEMLLREKLDVLVQVCRGLHYAHERGIVHRDVKPSNIRLLEDGTAKIMDFGIAKLGGTGVTKTGMMVGTVHYMSPEQIRGLPLDGRSDLFSAGVILYELLAGRRPFPGEAPTAVLYKIVSEPVQPLDVDLGPATSDIEAIVLRALAKEREERYAHAGEMAQALAGVLATLAGTATAHAEALASVAVSQRLMREGRIEESVRRLQELAQAHPDSLEARRALRVATREMQRQKTTAPPEPDDFPELAVTMQAPPTRRSAEDEVPTSYIPSARRPLPEPVPVSSTPALPPEVPAAAGSRPGGTRLWAVAGATLVVVLVSGFLLSGLRRGGGAQRVAVRSRPPGAVVLLDGRDTGVRTDGEIEIPESAEQVTLAFRKEGHQEASRLVRMPLEGNTVSVSLTPAQVAVSPPPGVEAPEATPPPQRPDAPAAASGRVSLRASYPVEVIWQGRTLVRGPSGEMSLPVGRQTLTLVAAQHFWRSVATVDVREGATETLEAPALGKIHIRANPDNCQVYIDGTFVDYPPIMDRALTVGIHKVSFRWPDGKRTDETIEASAEAPVYVMGRKD